MTNSKTTKRALVSSALAMFMCVAMLIGTTFAWFTDTASTSVNKIQAGTLDVALEVADGENADGTTKWVSAEGKTLDFVKADGAAENEAILWEPGCTYSLPELRIVNKGNLALKYKVVITGIKGDAELNKVIDWTIEDEDDVYAAATEHSLAVNESRTFTISGRMQASAGNAYQGKSIEGISITVYATQDTVEHDSNNNQYDADATYDIPWDGVTMTAPEKDATGVYHLTNAAEVAYAMEHSTPNMIGYNGNEYAFGAYVLESNIDFGGATVSGFACNSSNNFQGSFDGQGFTISNFVIDTSNSNSDRYAGLFGYLYGATVKNLNVSGATVIGQTQVGVLAGCVSDNSIVTNCNVYDSVVYATKKVGTIAGYTLNSTITDCHAENCNVYCEENDANECGAIIGFENTNTTASNNTTENVTVVTGADYVANGVAKQGNNYLISNAQGLVYCATTFTRSDNTINKVFKLESDVDMSGIAWTPWCNENQYFGGLFDGQGHTIKNLTINDNHTAYDGHAVGFIGRLGENANGDKIIKNVTFDKANVSGHHYVGVAVGYNEFGKVDNVRVTNSKVTATHVEGADSCGDKAGALIGMCGPNPSYIVVTNCSATNCEVKAARDAAQLIGYGYANTTFSNLSATDVTVTAVKGNCAHERAGIVSANALVGNGTVNGLTLN